MTLARPAHAAGLKHGVIQDKLFLPEFAKLLVANNAGSSVASCRSASMPVPGYSTGRPGNSRRPSWNSQRPEGGGLALDMMAH